MKKIDKRPRNNQNSQNNAPRGGNESSYGQNKELFCHVCGEKTHLTPKCKQRNKVAYNDWYVNQLKRAQQHKQCEGEKDEVEKIKEKVKEDMSKGWCTFQAQSNCKDSENQNSEPHGDAIHQEVEFKKEGSERFNFLKDVFILDTRSTILAMIMNENLVTNIRKSATPVGLSVKHQDVRVVSESPNIFQLTGIP